MTDSIQLLGISNAIVDVLAHVDDDFLQKIAAPRGSMTLIDQQRAREIYGMMGPATEKSGGSVANTIAGFANLGGRAAYIGRVKADQLGEIFVHDMRSLGVDIRTDPATDGSPTARCHVLITPDGQRTMQTYLGACTELSTADVTPSSIGTPGIVLLEGYVWDIAEGPALVNKAIDIARKNGSRVALSLSDSFCVERHQKEFRSAIKNGVDIVFADENEVIALFQAKSFTEVLDALDGLSNMFVITRSAKGSVIVHGSEKVEQKAIKVDKVIDTTGAGDAYTAGFLFGLASGRSLVDCARMGTWCATGVIQQVGGRIEKNALSGFK
ncbi:MAG: adenosine kinase [Gammaproteobacteria bacterium]|nr:adenosine kinase [Gammaproteobacteria bacterium]MDH4314043.1 adenosine kinase [Gammaproteobacteria bacterium]MDH5213517.1 adenosine kinase [Gammaproteobacteria bacterium]MDH5500120.1 adenosine kinase [Gammaproteobacteria bacterium]